MMSKIKELYYYITGKPYFVIFVISHGRKVKRFIQLAASKEKGANEFLINKSLKCAWSKPESDSVIIDGLKFMCFVDLNNAIPLKITKKTDIKTGEIFNKITTIETIESDVEELEKKYKSGEPLALAEIRFPPTIMFQKIEATFVKLILSVTTDKNEWLMYVIIAALVVFGFVAYMYLNGGQPPISPLG